MPHILLLHGAIGAAPQLAPLAAALAAKYTVHSLNFSGHGGAPMADGPFSIAGFAGEVCQYMEKNHIESAALFGYSMGGYVALYMAQHSPQKVSRVITLGTKFDWTPEIAARETRQLDPEKIAAKLPAFAETLRERHAPNDWKEVLARTRDMMTRLGAATPLKQDDLVQIATPVLVMLGDRDKMVSLEETVKAFQALPNAQLCVIPGAPHIIEQVRVEIVAFHVLALPHDEM